LSPFFFTIYVVELNKNGKEMTYTVTVAEEQADSSQATTTPLSIPYQVQYEAELQSDHEATLGVNVFFFTRLVYNLFSTRV
jgi:hypothetical protein